MAESFKTFNGGMQFVALLAFQFSLFSLKCSHTVEPTTAKFVGCTKDNSFAENFGSSKSNLEESAEENRLRTPPSWSSVVAESLAPTDELHNIAK